MSDDPTRRDDDVTSDAAQAPDAAPSLRGEIASGTVWVGAGRVVSVGLSLALTIVAERQLATAPFGRFMFVFALTTITGIAAQVGLHQTVLREVGAAEGPRTRGAVVRAARRVWAGAIAAFAALTLGGVAVAGVLDVDLGASAWSTFVAVVGLTAGRSYEIVIGEAFRGVRDYRAASLLGGNVTYGAAVVLAAATWLVAGRTTLDELYLVVGGAGAVAAVVAEAAYRRSSAFPPADDPDWTARRLLRLAWPVFASSTTTVSLTQVDVLVVATAAAAAEVGIYGVAARLVLLVTMPLGMLNLVVAPIIADLHARGQTDRLQRIVQVTATLAAAPALVVLAVFVVFPGTVLGTIYGPEFRAGAVVLAVLSLGRMFNAWTGACGITVLMIGRQRTHMAITVSTGVVRVALSLWLVRVYGVTAVAVAASAEAVVTNVLLWRAALRHAGVRTQASVTATYRAVRDEPDLVRSLLRRLPGAGRLVG